MEIKSMDSQQAHQQITVPGGLPVRSDLRAGLSFEEIQQQIGDLWGQLSNSVSNAIGNLGGGSAGTPSA